jgi:hypothetical protein
MENAISLPKVLEKIQALDENGKFVPFSCIVMPYDSNRKELRTPRYYENVVLESKLSKAYASKINISKRPDHYKNGTRNIRLQDGSTRKIHIRSIHLFNNQPVIW